MNDTELPEHEPQRLLDDPTVTASFRRDLRSFAALPIAYDALAGLARLQEAMVLPPAPPVTPANGPVLPSAGQATAKLAAAASPASSGLSLGLAGKISAWGLSGALALGAGYAAWRPSTRGPERQIEATQLDPPSSDANAKAAPVSPAAAEVKSAVLPTAAEPTLPEEDAAPALPERSAKSTTDTRASKRATSTKAVLTEVELLAAMRRQLSGSPAQVLELAAEHERRFPKGHLVQEREGLRVLARFAVGDRKAAKRDAQEYLRRFPSGPLTFRVKAALENANP